MPAVSTNPYKPAEANPQAYEDMANRIKNYFDVVHGEIRSMDSIYKLLQPQQLFQQEWDAANPQTEEERMQVYETCEGMMFDLCYRATLDKEHNRERMVRERVKLYAPDGPHIVEYAAGVGQEALELLKHGYAVTLVDVGHCAAFAKWQINCDWYSALCDGDAVIAHPNEFWERTELTSIDVLVNFEFFEHVDDPVSYVQRFHDILKPDGIMICNCRSFNAHAGHVEDTFQYQYNFEHEIANVGFLCIDFPFNNGQDDSNIFNLQVWRKTATPQVFNGDDWRE